MECKLRKRSILLWNNNPFLSIYVASDIIVECERGDNTLRFWDSSINKETEELILFIENHILISYYKKKPN